MNRHTTASGTLRRPHGFTTVELLVVIGIIVLLASMLLVMVSRGYTASRRVRAQADLQVIALGLEAYKQDFGDYPRPAGPLATDGAATLCWALVAPGLVAVDGADGPGFRTRVGGQGKVYGPYIDTSAFNIATIGGVQYLTSKVMRGDIGDVDATGILQPGQTPPILYIPARPAVSTQRQVTPQTAYVGQNSVGGGPYMYDLDQCSTWIGSTSWITGIHANGVAPGNQIRTMMGDLSYMRGEPPANQGVINGTETARCTAPYILWAAGRGGLFGLRYDNSHYTTDNVANFDFDSSVLVK